MENLNTIPKTGNYGSGVDLHNDNYSKIGLKLETLENMSLNEKGYFETLSALQTKYPTPQSGWQAYVKDAGSSTGYYVANVNSSGNWVVTAAEAPPINVDLAGYAKTGGSDKTIKDVEDEIVQLAGDVEQLAYVNIKNEVVNGNFENGLIAPFSRTDGFGGASTLAINSLTPISGNYDVRLTITTPATTSGRPIFNGLNKAGNIGDKIYLHFYAKILSGIPIIYSIFDGESALTIYGGEVINGRNARIIEVKGIDSTLGRIYFNSLSVWDMQMDNFMRINLTETFGAGNEPTKEEMDLLISTLGIDYFEGETTIPAQKVMQWLLNSQQQIDNKATQIETDLNGKVNVIKNDVANLEYYNPYTGLDDANGFILEDGRFATSQSYKTTGFMRVVGTGIEITGTTRGLAGTIYSAAYDINKNLLYTFQILPTTNHTINTVHSHEFTSTDVAYVRISLSIVNQDTWSIKSVGSDIIPTDMIFEELNRKELRIRYLESERDKSSLLNYKPTEYQPPHFIKSSRAGEDADFIHETRTVDDVYNAYDRLADAHIPFFRKKTKIGQSQIPDAFNGAKDDSVYDINLYELAKHDLPPDAPKLLIATGIHGMEEPNVFATYYFIRDVLENFQKSKILRYIHDECRILIVPLQNPWGWQNYTRENGRSVDLNRNWDYNWETSTGAKGESPMSESESVAMLNLINDNPDIFCFFEIHSRGDTNVSDVRFSGYTNIGDELTFNAFRAARNVVDVLYITGLVPANAVAIVPAEGGNASLYRWAWYVKGIPSSNPESLKQLNESLPTFMGKELIRQQTHYLALLFQNAFAIHGDLK